MKPAKISRMRRFWFALSFTVIFQTASFSECTVIPGPYNLGNCTFADLNGDGSAIGLNAVGYVTATRWLHINPGGCGVPEDVCDCAEVVGGAGHPCDGCSYYSSYSPAVCASNSDCTIPCGGIPELGAPSSFQWTPIAFALLAIFGLSSLTSRRQKLG